MEPASLPDCIRYTPPTTPTNVLTPVSTISTKIISSCSVFAHVHVQGRAEHLVLSMISHVFMRYVHAKTWWKTA